MKYILFFLIILKYVNCEYSSIEFHENLIKETGNVIHKLHNVCLYSTSYTYSRIVDIRVNNMSEYGKIINTITDYSWFYQFKFSNSNRNYDNKEYFDEEIYLTSSWLNYNIVHFLDNMILYNTQNDNKYPPINHLIMADFNPQSTLPYNNMMLKMMINNYKPFKMSFQSEISKLIRKLKNHVLCYKTVYLFIRSENGGFLGVFRNYLIGRKYRDEGYKYLKMEMKYKNEISITIINRKTQIRSRSITNLKMIKKMIKSMGYNYNEIYFEDKNPKEQIESIMNSKIIITPFGSATANIIWLISSKSLIIDCMSTYVMIDYSYYIYSLNYKYIPLFSLFHNLNPNTFDDAYDEKYKFEFIPTVCQPIFKHVSYPLYKTSGNNMTISLKQIEYSLKYGLNYVKY